MKLKAQPLIPPALAVLATANSLQNGFAYDDNWMFIRNGFIHRLSNVVAVFSTNPWAPVDFIGEAFPYFRPFQAGLLILEYRAFQDRAWGFHLVSVLLHVSVTYLVYLVVKEITARQLLAIISAGLFAVHPVHAEPVAWISAQPESLFALFSLLAFYSYLKYARTRHVSQLVFVFGLYFSALLCKETAMVLPVVIITWELLCGRGSLWEKLRSRLTVVMGGMFVVTTALYLLIRYRATGFLIIHNTNSLGTVIRTAPKVVLSYLRLLLLPMDYSIHHFTPAPATFTSSDFLLPMIVLLAGTIAIVTTGSRTLKFAAAWFALWLLPPLAALGTLLPNAVQERYLYLPSVGFCLALALGIEWLLGSAVLGPVLRIAATAVVVVVLALFGLVHIKQNRVWRDNLTVFQHNVAVNPNSPPSHVSLAVQYYLRTELQQAEAEALRALQLDPDNLEAYRLLSLIAEKRGDLGRAIDDLERAKVSVNREKNTTRQIADTYLSLGLLYSKREHFDVAEENLRKAASLGQYVYAWDELGELYFDRGLCQEALSSFQHALQYIPKSAILHFKIGRAYECLSHSDQARREYQEYLRLAPRGKYSKETSSRLARL